jgi:hypothetical protein
VAILLPLGLYMMTSPLFMTKLPVVLKYTGHTVLSPQYSAKSEVSGYTMTLTDTRYLDYVTTTFGTFGPQAIVDPRVYHGFPDIKLRYTVSRVRFVLVPKLDNFLMAIPERIVLSVKGITQ